MPRKTLNRPYSALGAPLPRRTGRGRERLLDGPAVPVKASEQGVVGHPRLVCPFGQAHGSAIVCQQAVSAGVAGLLQLCCPPAVARFIVAVVVDPVDAVCGRRARSHVGKEVLKRHPLVTHLNSALPISVIAAIVDVKAPFEYSVPRIMFRSPSLAVPCASTLRALCAASGSEACSIDGFLGPAPTTAQPDGVPRLFVTRVKPKDGPKPEGAPGQVFEVVRVPSRIGLVHQKNLRNRFGRWKGPGGRCRLSLGPLHCSTRDMEGLAHAA